jgi:hypothetical protein
VHPNPDFQQRYAFTNGCEHGNLPPDQLCG